MKYKSPYQMVTPYGEPTIYARYVQGAPMQTYWPYLHDLLFVKRIPFYTLEVYNRIVFPDRVWKLWTNRPSSRARWANAALASGGQTCVTHPKAVAWGDEVSVSLIYHQDEAVVTSHLAKLAQFLGTLPSSSIDFDTMFIAMMSLDI